MESIIERTGRKPTYEVTPETSAFFHMVRASGRIVDVSTSLPISVIQQILDVKRYELDVLKELKANTDIQFSTDTPECHSYITTNF
jgi:hypothetical protein